MVYLQTTFFPFANINNLERTKQNVGFHMCNT